MNGQRLAASLVASTRTPSAKEGTEGHQGDPRVLLRIAFLLRPCRFEFQNGQPRLMRQRFHNRKIVTPKRAGRLELVTILKGSRDADFIEWNAFFRLVLEQTGRDAAKLKFLHGLVFGLLG